MEANLDSLPFNVASGFPRAGGDVGLSHRGKVTRNKLLSSARWVFERTAYRAVRVDQITNRAGVAHGTFYTYFQDKEAVFLELVEDLARDLFEASHPDHRDGGDPSTRLLAANRHYLEAFRRHSAMVVRLHEAAETDPVIGQWLQHAYEVFYARIAGGIERLQQNRTADPTLPPWPTGRALGAMVEGFAFSWIRTYEPELDVAAVVLTSLWCGAIGLPRVTMESLSDGVKATTTSKPIASARSRRT